MTYSKKSFKCFVALLTFLSLTTTINLVCSEPPTDDSKEEKPSDKSSSSTDPKTSASFSKSSLEKKLEFLFKRFRKRLALINSSNQNGTPLTEDQLDLKALIYSLADEFRNYITNKLNAKSRSSRSLQFSPRIFIQDLLSRIKFQDFPNLRGVNLSGLSFSLTNLSKLNLSGAGFAECYFLGTNLANSNFEHADFTGAVFNIYTTEGVPQVTTTNANFNNAVLRKTNLNGNLPEIQEELFTQAISSNWTAGPAELVKIIIAFLFSSEMKNS